MGDLGDTVVPHDKLEETEVIERESGAGADADADAAQTLPLRPDADAELEAVAALVDEGEEGAQATDGEPFNEPEASNSNDGPSITQTIPLPAPVEAPRANEPGEASGSEEGPAPRVDGGAAPLLARAKVALRVCADFLTAHSAIAAGLALVGVSAILACMLLGLRSARMPSDDQIREDAQARLAAPSYTLGSFGVDEPLILRTADVVSKGHSSTRKDAVDVQLEVTFANSGMQSQADATLTYTGRGDSWECVAASTGKASHHATTGVSQARVIDALDDLLEQADDPDDGRESLKAIYHGASVEVVSEQFDESDQTDTLVLSCTRSGTFVAYECELTAHFRFAAASGAWELAEVQASDGAKDISLTPLVASWRGTFSHQESSSAKCLAAGESGLTVVVTSVKMTDDGGASIAGTLSGVAHLHEDLDEDAPSCEGDVSLDKVPFTGKLSSGEVELDAISLLAGNKPKRDEAGIVFDCTTQDLTGGTVELTLSFGSAKAPDEATATLRSTHSYEDFFLLLVPYHRVARFTDTFTLEKL